MFNVKRIKGSSIEYKEMGTVKNQILIILNIAQF